MEIRIQRFVGCLITNSLLALQNSKLLITPLSNFHILLNTVIFFIIILNPLGIIISSFCIEQFSVIESLLYACACKWTFVLFVLKIFGLPLELLHYIHSMIRVNVHTYSATKNPPRSHRYLRFPILKL